MVSQLTPLEKTVKVGGERKHELMDRPPPPSEEIAFWTEIRQNILGLNAVIERRIDRLKQK